MWHVIAEEETRCSECFHSIPAGSRCLSQMPMELPDGSRRGVGENYCIGCSRCSLKGNRQPCYVRRLSHWYAPKETVEVDTPCGHCGETVPEGTRTFAQRVYVGIEDEPESASDGTEARTGGSAAAAAAGAGAARPTPAVWNNLSAATQRKFQTGGLGGPRGIRSPKMGQRLFERTIPKSIRNLGEGAVKDYMKGKQGSHIKSVSNSPHLAKAPSNMVWEDASKNLSRGSRNMARAEVAATKSAGRATAIRLAARNTLRSGVMAAAMEGAVAGVENIFHWRRGRKTGKEAVKDAAWSTATAGAFGLAAAPLLVWLPLGPLGIPVAIAGGAVWAGSSVYRVARAAGHDIPLAEGYVFFCKGRDCPSGFARTMAA